MADEPENQLATIPSMDVEEAEPLQLETTLHDFVPSRVVYDRGGKKYQVPATAKANRHSSQMIVSKIRYLLDRKLDALTNLNVPIDVKVIKDLTVAAAQLHAMSVDAYGNGKIPIKEDKAAAFEKMATDLVEAAAKGTATALSDDFNKKLLRIQSLGRATKPAEPINITSES